MTRHVWLLGGTGKVGDHAARLLVAEGLEVTTVSRRSANPGRSYRHISLDLATPETALPVQVGDIAVNLTEATSTEHILSILQHGAAFLETSATAEYVLPKREAVRVANLPGTLVDCVGVAPGLTNLMAHEMRRAHPNLRHLHIGGELGLGEHAGAAATRWFLASLGAATTAKIDADWQKVPTGFLSQKFPFQKGRSSRLAVGFPFVEQALLAQEFGNDVESVLTYLAFSPPWVTRLLWTALRLGMGPLASRKADGLTRLLLRVPQIGETSTRVVVTGKDDAGHSAWLRLETGEQSRATAAIVVATTLAFDPARPMSISSIADWLSLDDAVAVLKQTHAQTRMTRSNEVERDAVTAKSGQNTKEATL